MVQPRIHLNDTLNGIELYFDDKPDAKVLDDLKVQGFRWHPKYKKWYAKQSNEREDFIKKYFNVETKAQNIVTSKKEKELPLTSTKEDNKNCFASVYNQIGIGNDLIYKNTDISVVDFRNNFRGGYFEEENVWVSFKNNDETIYIVDLDDTSNLCKSYTLFIDGIVSSREEKDAVLYCVNELQFKKISDLVSAVKNGEDLDKLSVNVTDIKASKVFSPFKEVSPLKELPNKWTQKQLVKALYSGQIYKAVCDYTYSDDYAYDSATNFSRGREESLPYLANMYVESWSSKTTSINETDRNENTCVLKVSNSYKSISLYFDLDCDHHKGAEKREAAKKEIENYNNDLESKVIAFEDVVINPYGFYNITCLDKDDNTGLYKENNHLVQGINLIDFEGDKFSYKFEKITELSEAEIVAEQFYKISDLFNIEHIDLSDERYIALGNHNVVVSGKTLLEEASEGVIFPYVSDHIHCGNTFEKIKNELSALKNGSIYWGVNVSKVDYSDSLNRVLKEESRILQMTNEKPKFSSLFDRISEIEKQRKSSQSPKQNNIIRNNEYSR